MEWQYSEDKKHIELDSTPKQKNRITGHRISSVLGLNKYQSPFGAWCEITKLVKLPFEDTKYTLFGKAVEPKLIEYVGKRYPNVMSIEDYYGNNIEAYRWNNFKDESDIFGGIIDAVSTRNDMKTIAMICECKTSSHAEQWANNNVPVDYLLQGALYSYLKGLDRVLFVCTFPQEMDYNHPEQYEVTDDNTILVVKKLSEILIPIDGKYLNIEEVIDYAKLWWDTYIIGHKSPDFDEEQDKEYLKLIRASKPTRDNDLLDVCEEAIKLAKEIAELKISSGLKAKEDLLKVLEASIKEKLLETNTTTAGKYTLNKSVKVELDTKRLEKEQPSIYNKYNTLEKITYRLNKDLKEEK